MNKYFQREYIIKDINFESCDITLTHKRSNLIQCQLVFDLDKDNHRVAKYIILREC